MNEKRKVNEKRRVMMRLVIENHREIKTYIFKKFKISLFHLIPAGHRDMMSDAGRQN